MGTMSSDFGRIFSGNLQKMFEEIKKKRKIRVLEKFWGKYVVILEEFRLNFT